jgi:hypothetical protein
VLGANDNALRRRIRPVRRPHALEPPRRANQPPNAAQRRLPRPRIRPRTRPHRSNRPPPLYPVSHIMICAPFFHLPSSIFLAPC